MLLLHGFTGAPTEMRLVAGYLHERGLTVSAPLLPGHGTTVADCNACRWTEWTAAAAGALAELRGRCQRVFVAGLSMGTLLSIVLAADNPDLRGVMLYSPAVKLAERRLFLTPALKHVRPILPKDANADQDLTDPSAAERLWSYDENPVAAGAELFWLKRAANRRLPEVTSPLLIVHSTLDRSIHRDSARLVYQRAGTPPADKHLVTLANSGHNLVVDSEWETAADLSYRFVLKYA
ncbi:MAG: alpha/beta fold hydrolase [Caldilineaceae bacterium]